VRPALVGRKRMNFINDHGPDGLQQMPAFLGREQDKQRFRRRNKDVRRPPEHLLAIRHRRVAGPDQHPQLRHEESGLEGSLADLGQWLSEIFLDVVTESFQRGDIQDLSLVFELARQRLRKEPIDAGEKRGKGLPGTGWRRNQRVPSGLDDRPGLGLHLGRDADGGLKPLSDDGVKAR